MYEEVSVLVHHILVLCSTCSFYFSVNFEYGTSNAKNLFQRLLPPWIYKITSHKNLERVGQNVTSNSNILYLVMNVRNELLYTSVKRMGTINETMIIEIWMQFTCSGLSLTDLPENFCRHISILYKWPFCLTSYEDWIPSFKTCVQPSCLGNYWMFMSSLISLSLHVTFFPQQALFVGSRWKFHMGLYGITSTQMARMGLTCHLRCESHLAHI